MLAPMQLEVACRRDRPGAYNDIDDQLAEWPASKVALISCDNPRHREIEALFCAAPDLLAACEDAVEELRTDENYVSENGAEAEFLVKLRAAIAKARPR